MCRRTVIEHMLIHLHQDTTIQMYKDKPLLQNKRGLRDVLYLLALAAVLGLAFSLQMRVKGLTSKVIELEE